MTSKPIPASSKPPKDPADKQGTAYGDGAVDNFHPDTYGDDAWHHMPIDVQGPPFQERPAG